MKDKDTMIKKFTEKIANTWVDRKAHWFYGSFEIALMRLYNDRKPLNLIKRIMKEDGEILSKPSEMIFVYHVASAQRSHEGDYAEVGVYKGATAKLICEAKGDKHFYLFDTFGGLPEASVYDRKFAKHMFSVGPRQATKRLKKYSNIHFHNGLFPESAKSLKKKRFAFVHLDVDVYSSTKACLEFFYHRMTRGGIILSHDYTSAEGVKKAFDDFFKNKPEGIIQLPMSQCMIVKK